MGIWEGESQDFGSPSAPSLASPHELVAAAHSELGGVGRVDKDGVEPDLLLLLLCHHQFPGKNPRDQPQSQPKFREREFPGEKNPKTQQDLGIEGGECS